MRICLVSLNAYDLLARSPIPRHCGGAERQQELLARAFTERGHDVTFVTSDFGQDDGVVHEGITVYKTCPPEAGLPGLRFFLPRWTSIRRALARADADVYYQQGGDTLTGQVGGWARAHGRQFVFMVASDFDCHPELPNLTTRRERVLYRRGLRSAHRCISQTRRQQELLSRHFDRQVEVIASLGPREHGLSVPTSCIPRSVLWIGRLDPVKRLEFLLEVAQRCPEVTFHVVAGANHTTKYANELEDRARRVPNVVSHGRLSRDEVNRLYREVSILSCTSSWEGFPNTFLEAWSVGLPLVTTFDPDHLVSTHRLGLVSLNTGEMASHIGRLLSSEAEYQRYTERCYAYFSKHHTFEPVMAAHERLWNHQRA